MDFIDTMRQLFGFNPATGETLQPGARIPAPRMAASGAAPAFTGLDAGSSQEAQDPSTPSPTGQVLARLQTQPRRLAPPASGALPQSQQAGASPFGGIGSEIAGGLGGFKRGMSGAEAFASGLSGAVKAVNDRAAAANKAQNEADKAKLDVYKALFDIEDKKAQRARGDRQDAETKRWHDIMAPSYSNEKKKDAPDQWDDLSASDQSNAGLRFMKMAGIPDMSKPDGQAAWDLLNADEKQKRIGILRRLQPSLAKKLFDGDGNPTGAEPPGPAGAKAPKPAASAAKPAKPKASEEDDESGDDDETTETPAAPAAKPTATPPAAAPRSGSPAAAPQASPPAAAGTWRRYKSTDGTIKLFNPATGQTQSIDEAPAPQAQPSYQQEYESMGRAYGAGQ